MNNAEVAGHLGVGIACGSLGLFFGLGGLLVGIVVFLVWTFFTSKRRNSYARISSNYK